MTSSQETFEQAQQRLEEAKRERARALQQVNDLCETGRRSLVIPFLMANMQRKPELKKIRLWQLDAIIFHTSRDRALKLIRKTRETIHDQSPIKDGYATLGWATESQEKTVRMTTWLYQLLEREKLAKFTVPDGFPYTLLYDLTQTTDNNNEKGAFRK
ncbi:hypothetical protein [Bifidobacterium sp. SO1]|uniref:hypothetical protein n=1 Tax=Bifidobacterium sp. SO1 TaxID=2809029 RepID=UPI001BDC22A3|nr:hypothetical protein [Bifidobacterium sp. SO1]MBT1162147.1 hypothetical protein [Bifidobacterium sp. SO1]